MKIISILSPIVEKWQQSKIYTRERFTEQEFNMAYKAVVKESLTTEEIKALAQQFTESDKWTRTAASAIFLLSRMYIIVHSDIPHGMTEKQAETFFIPSYRMEQWAEKQGLNPTQAIANAKQRAKNIPKKVKRPEAAVMMSNYYRANKNKLIDVSELKKHRDVIINKIMNGTSAEQAFAPYIKPGN